MDTIIATQGLTKIFGGKIVVNRLNLNVPQGAIFALLGGNGAGKSTTIRMLTGLLPPDGGSATILGEDCWAQAIPLRHRIGYVPEKPRFYDWMTVREIVGKRIRDTLREAVSSGLAPDVVRRLVEEELSRVNGKQHGGG